MLNLVRHPQENLLVHKTSIWRGGLLLLRHKPALTRRLVVYFCSAAYSTMVREENRIKQLIDEVAGKPTDRDAPLKGPHFPHPVNAVSAGIMSQQRQQQASPMAEPNGGNACIAEHYHRRGKQSMMCRESEPCKRTPRCGLKESESCDIVDKPTALHEGEDGIQLERQ